MDATTPKGREALAHAERALRTVESRTGTEFVKFDDTVASKVDGVICRDGIIVAFYEVKSRKCSSEEMRTRFENRWLLSYDKLQSAYSLTSCLKVPFVGVLHCQVDDVVMVKKFWDGNGKLLSRWYVDGTLTQMTVNGGQIERTNAYIEMSGAIQYAITDP